MADIQALAHLCSKVEALAPGSFAGITISSSDFTHIERALFPTLPYSFSAAITHVPLEPADFGSCVKAISCGQPITCPDIQNDSVFDPRWRQVCLTHGLRAIQSRPVYVDGKPRGTFVLAFREPTPESGWDAALMTFAADVVGQALSSASDGLSAAKSTTSCS
jgi:GAF domain-containing protein